MTVSSVNYDYSQTQAKTPDPNVVANNRAISSAVRLLNSSGALGDGHEFSVAIDRATKQAVVRIVDSSTNELVDQFPSEYILHIAQQIGDSLAQQSQSEADKAL